MRRDENNSFIEKSVCKIEILHTKEKRIQL
jgi:hypothetical protein